MRPYSAINYDYSNREFIGSVILHVGVNTSVMTSKVSIQTSILPGATRTRAKVKILSDLRKELAGFQLEKDHQMHWIKALLAYFEGNITQVPSESNIHTDELIRFGLTKEEQKRHGADDVLVLFEFKHQGQKGVNIEHLE